MPDNQAEARGKIRGLLDKARTLGRLARGLYRYSRTGSTPDDAYHSLIWLHCRTNGRSTDLLHSLVRRRSPPAPIPSADGILGSLSAADVAMFAEELAEKGYCKFTPLLPADTCQRLTSFALETEGITSPVRPDCPRRAVYDPQHVVAEAYKFDEPALVANRDIQVLLADLSIIAVAQAYLKCLPVQSLVAMWWSTPVRLVDDARAELAQMYHFDMDRIKWLKFFIYLTEVTSGRGPHCYIATSHRAGNQPADLLNRGYVRLRDDEIESRYPPENRIEVTGPAGTIFAADTRGFHKGITPRTGDRLVLQLEFADSLFGGSYRRPAFPTDCAPQLAECRRRMPRLYSRFA